MIYIKNKYRTKLIDLNANLANIIPDFKKLSESKQSHPSH